MTVICTSNCSSVSFSFLYLQFVLIKTKWDYIFGEQQPRLTSGLADLCSTDSMSVPLLPSAVAVISVFKQKDALRLGNEAIC